MLTKLISNHQSAFVKGRQILDSILVANECLDSRIKQGIPGVICKIELKKAFDNVKWSFLIEVLQNMGFGSVWQKWILGCIYKVPFSILINGSAFEESGLLGGFLSSTSPTAVKVSHLQFADDALGRNLKYMLLWFQCASGFTRSCLFGVGEVQDIDGLAEILNCACNSFPTNYLGMPLGDKTNSASKWDKAIEKVIRSFLWDESSEIKKHHWVSWRNVCKPLRVGGLGIRKLRTMNRSLFQKWWWRLGNEPDALWSRVIKDKYGTSDLGWKTKQPTGSHGVSLWRNIYSCSEEIFNLCQFKIAYQPDGEGINWN